MSCFYACIIRCNILSLYLQEAPGVQQLWLYGVQTSNLCNVSSIHRLHVSSEIFKLAVKENVLPVNIIKCGCSQAELFPMLPNCLCALSISGCGTYAFVDHGLLQNVCVFLISGEYGICLDLDWWFWMSVLCGGCLRLLKIWDSKVAYI
jgi:hypothetical protein